MSDVDYLLWIYLLSTLRLSSICSRAQEAPTASAIVITRPPEIITMLKFSAEGRATPIFVSFDSHPRRKHPQGAAFIFHPSPEAAALYLTELLQFDRSLLSDPAFQWQVQLLAQYSAHVFIAKDVPQCRQEPNCFNVVEAYLKPSLDIMTLRAELTELRDRNRALNMEVESLNRDNRLLREQARDYEDGIRYLKRLNASTVTDSQHYN